MASVVFHHVGNAAQGLVRLGPPHFLCRSNIVAWLTTFTFGKGPCKPAPVFPLSGDLCSSAVVVHRHVRLLLLVVFFLWGEGWVGAGERRVTISM
eukprot:1201981-Karenia_brevis.AAC.1